MLELTDKTVNPGTSLISLPWMVLASNNIVADIAPPTIVDPYLIY